MKSSIQQTAQSLLLADNIVILAHRRPDGDTLGSAFGLFFALEKLGKVARVECADPIPTKFNYFFSQREYTPKQFAPDFVVAVDAATLPLLGSLGPVYENRIDLVIDHHKSNSFYGKATLLDVSSPAAAQVMYHVICAMGLTLDKEIANPLFTGIVTDTGGFRFASVTPETHRVGALLMECGAEHAMINRLLFETNSRGRLEVERRVLESIVYAFNGLCATILIDDGWEKEFDIDDDDLSGIASLPRSIEGVLAGVTLRNQGEGVFRVSLRTQSPVDASAICATFGGGGHANAAGCTLRGTEEQVRQQVTQAVQAELEKNQLWTASS